VTPAGNAPAVVDAHALWMRARSAVTAAAYPSSLAYTIAITGKDGDTPVSDRYRAVSDPGDGSVRVFPIGDEQLSRPAPVPRGINWSFVLELCIYRGGCGGVHSPVGRPVAGPDLLGEPILKPTYMFGLRYERGARHSGTATAGGLPIIATVSSGVRHYRVTLLGTPVLDGVPTYHLGLTPLHDPKRDRLRELWIGANDFLPRKAVVFGNFTMAPLVDVPWTVDFSVIDHAPYVTAEMAMKTLYMPHRRVVHDAEIAFQDIRERGKSIYGMPLIQPDPSAGALVEPSP
jgi:hypothetical protein